MDFLIAAVSSENEATAEAFAAFMSVTVDLEGGDSGRVFCRRLLLGVGCGLGLGCRRLSIGCGLLRLLQLLILCGQVSLQAIDLALEFLAERLDLIFDRWLGWRLCLSWLGVFFSGAWGSAGVAERAN